MARGMDSIFVQLDVASSGLVPFGLRSKCIMDFTELPLLFFELHFFLPTVKGVDLAVAWR